MTTVTFSTPTFSTRTVAPRPSTSRLRLTRRGRVVFTTIAAAPLVALALFFGLNAGGAVATQDAPTSSLTYVTVDGGQTLWDLAAQVAPQADPREFTAQVVALNQLESSEIHPGQRLAIPEQYAP